MFSTHLTAPARAKDKELFLANMPATSDGWLILDAGTVNEEIVCYTAVGPNFVVLKKDPNTTLVEGVGRGLYETTQTDHDTGTPVQAYTPLQDALKSYLPQGMALQIVLPDGTEVNFRPHLKIKKVQGVNNV